MKKKCFNRDCMYVFCQIRCHILISRIVVLCLDVKISNISLKILYFVFRVQLKYFISVNNNYITICGYKLCPLSYYNNN